MLIVLLFYCISTLVHISLNTLILYTREEFDHYNVAIFAVRVTTLGQYVPLYV